VTGVEWIVVVHLNGWVTHVESSVFGVGTSRHVNVLDEDDETVIGSAEGFGLLGNMDFLGNLANTLVQFFRGG
jgi:hypothetical protein